MALAYKERWIKSLNWLSITGKQKDILKSSFQQGGKFNCFRI